MNMHHANPRSPRRKRHLFDPSRIKIGVEVGEYGYSMKERDVRAPVERGEEAGVVEARDGMKKRQWHEPWSLVTQAPSYLTTTSKSTAAAPSTVIVTRIKGTTVVTGTPPASSSTSSKASTIAASTNVAVSSTPSTSAAVASASPSSSSAAETTSSAVSTSTPTVPSSTITLTASSSSTTQSPRSSASTIPAITLSSLPSSIQIATALTLVGSSSTPSSSGASSTGSSSTATGTAGIMSASHIGGSETLSTGGKVGAAIGAIAGAGILGLLLLWAYKRFSRDRRTEDPMNDQSFMNRRSVLHNGGYNNFDDGQGWDASDRAGHSEVGYAGQYTDADDGTLIATRQGMYNPGLNGDGASGQHQSAQMAMAHPCAATTYATYPVAPGSNRTRDLTHTGAYTSYADDDDDLPSPYAGHPYPVYDDTGRNSPTDYFGQAMSSANTDMVIAAQYGDASFSEDGHTIGQAIASPYVGGMAITNGERATAQRVPINNNGNGPQIPPFSPVCANNLFDSGLYADDGQQALGAKQLSRKSSQAQPRTARGDEQLRQEYRDLALAAQVDEPTTPTTATLVASGGFGIPQMTQRNNTAGHATQLAPMTLPERYRHGQPLSTLQEVETPKMTPSLKGTAATESNPFSDLPVLMPAARSSAESLALPLPQPGRPFIGSSTDARSIGSQASGLPSHYESTSSSMYLRHASPGISLPESPASYADQGRYRSPLGAPSFPSAVSLDIPSPTGTPQGGPRVSTSNSGWIPASGQRLAAVAGGSGSTLHNNASQAVSTQTRPVSTATDVDDAYDGI